MECIYCGKTYLGGNKKKDVVKHELYCMENPKRIKYSCDICEKKFDKRHGLIAHKKSCGKIKNKKIKNKVDYICVYCGCSFENGFKLGGHKVNCKDDPNYEYKKNKKIEKLSEIGKNRKLSEETKIKISKSRKEYLDKNPNKVPYLLNHSRKDSYPEIYFEKIFQNNKLELKKYYRVGRYELDFCIIEKKIDIEIDGDQHYFDKKIVESDKRRNKYLKSLGWDIVRVKWSDYQKLSIEDRNSYVVNLIGYINGLIKEKPIVENIEIKNYCLCGVEIYKTSKACIKCNSLNNRKIRNRPKLDDILKNVNEMGYVKTGIKYGVSDNTIRKWIKKEMESNSI
jgi:very-short-patch-repair endonuclease